MLWAGLARAATADVVSAEPGVGGMGDGVDEGEAARRRDETEDWFDGGWTMTRASLLGMACSGGGARPSSTANVSDSRLAMLDGRFASEQCKTGNTTRNARGRKPAIPCFGTRPKQWWWWCGGVKAYRGVLGREGESKSLKKSSGVVQTASSSLCPPCW